MKQINYKKLIIPNIPYVFFVYLFDKVGQATRLAPGADISEKILNITQGFSEAFSNALPSVHPLDLLIGIVGAVVIRLIVYVKGKNAKKYRKGAEYAAHVGVHNLKCKELYMDAQEDMHMNDYNKITALYSRLSVGDEDRDGGESNSIQNQKKFLESYARQLKLTNIRH